MTDLKRLRERTNQHVESGVILQAIETKTVLELLDIIEELEGIAYSAERWRHESAGQDTSKEPAARRFFFERLNKYFYPELDATPSEGSEG